MKPGWLEPYPSHYLYAPSKRLFEADIRFSERMLVLLLDDQFAQGLADVLVSRSLCTLDGCVLLTYTGDSARSLIAFLRDKGESFRDYQYGIVDPPFRYHVPMILEELERIGWREATPQELRKLEDIAEFNL